MIKLPKQIPRAESGVVCFEDDWPGIFLRGDDAIPMSMYLTQFLDESDRGEMTDPIIKAALRSLAESLNECNVGTQAK